MATVDSIEEWRPVPGFPGYLASSLGRVLGRRGWVLSPETTHDGYLRVVLYDAEGGRTRRTLHSVVADAFGIEGGPQVDHINGNKGDNRPANLRRVSQSDNIRADFERGARRAPRSAFCTQLRRVAAARVRTGEPLIRVARALGVSRAWLRKVR